MPLLDGARSGSGRGMARRLFALFAIPCAAISAYVGASGGLRVSLGLGDEGYGWSIGRFRVSGEIFVAKWGAGAVSWPWIDEI